MGKHFNTKTDREAIEALRAIVADGDDEIRRVQDIVYSVARYTNSYQLWDNFLRAYSTVDDHMIAEARRRDPRAGAVVYVYQEMFIQEASPMMEAAFWAYWRALCMVGMTAHQRLAWMAAHPG